jgi:hypothetical protein
MQGPTSPKTLCMKKIAVIVFHFGKHPWYLPFFLKSCAANPTIDFLFFADDKPLPNKPSNVAHIPFSLSAFNQLASAQLGFTVAIQKPYKLCDLKPAFGVIFSRWLMGYDIWGYADTDVILGNIRAFFTDAQLDAYDVFCVKDRYPAGFFTLLKNKPAVNRLFTKSKDYRSIFTSQQNFMFDECSTAYADVENGVPISQVPCPTESLLHLLEKEQAHIKTHFNYCVVEGIPGKLVWDKGRLLFRGQYEVLLYHLSDFKSNRYLQIPQWQMIPDVYFIDQFSFRRKTRFSRLVFWWSEKVKLHFHLQWRVMRIKWALRFKGKPVQKLPVGEFYYMNEKITIAITDQQNNYLQTATGKRRIVQMPFAKKQFFMPTNHSLFEWDGVRLHELQLDGKTKIFSPAHLLPSINGQPLNN